MWHCVVLSQDTLVALQALCEYGKRDTNRDLYNMQIDLESTSTHRWRQNIRLNRENWVNPQFIYIPHVWGQVKAVAQGTGIALMQVGAQIGTALMQVAQIGMALIQAGAKKVGTILMQQCMQQKPSPPTVFLCFFCGGEHCNYCKASAKFGSETHAVKFEFGVPELWNWSHGHS